MKEENTEEEIESEIDPNDEQSWPITKTASLPFANFYITKQSPSTCSGSQYKLSEQLANTSSKHSNFFHFFLSFFF
jgi:hypothetical protein